MNKSQQLENKTPMVAEYYVIEPTAGTNHWSLCPVENGLDLSDDSCRMTRLWLRRIPAGTFQMGSPDGETGRHGNERQRLVTITNDFLIGVFPVTQRQWELVMGENPAYFKDAGPCAPVEQVTYIDICGGDRRWPHVQWIAAESFIGRLRSKTGCGSIDLPTEAQWEYACRANSQGPLYDGLPLTDIKACPNVDAIAWYAANSNGTTHAVGQKLPNAWGLHDMLGNVWEWCRDWYDDDMADSCTDPCGPPVSFSRVEKGGNFMSRAGDCRAARRYDDDEARRYRNLGLRVVAGVPTSH